MYYICTYIRICTPYILYTVLSSKSDISSTETGHGSGLSAGGVIGVLIGGVIVGGVAVVIIFKIIYGVPDKDSCKKLKKIKMKEEKKDTKKYGTAN